MRVVASSRSTRLYSDSGAFADWVGNPSSSSRRSDQDLSLGFNARPSAAAHGGVSTGVWSSASTRQINYGVPADHMGMFVHAHHSLNQISNPTSGTATATALGVGVIPLLTATPYLTVDDGGRGGNLTSTTNNSIQFWQPQPSSLKTHVISDHVFGGSDGGGVLTATSGSTLTCQDCGNQAKKDCNHRRCRTCCKSRGFDCATHVKSTWVPATRRRERQRLTSAGGATAGSSASTSVTKKPRLTSHTTNSHTSTSNNTPRSFDTSSSHHHHHHRHHHQDASYMQTLPGQVRAPAVFKCVRVTALEDGDDEYAYQACVTISGHVLKGFLYDQGVETRDQTNIPDLSELHLGGGRGGGGGGRNVVGSLTSPPLDLPAVYGSSGGGLLG